MILYVCTLDLPIVRRLVPVSRGTVVKHRTATLYYCTTTLCTLYTNLMQEKNDVYYVVDCCLDLAACVRVAVGLQEGVSSIVR